MENLSIKWMDPKYYGINWDADDENPNKRIKKRERAKPFCVHPNCENRVSTEHGRPKPYCKDHVLENPYVKDLLERMQDIDPKEDRKRANEALKRAEEEQREADSRLGEA